MLGVRLYIPGAGRVDAMFGTDHGAKTIIIISSNILPIPMKL